jgi:hypothetical protein
MALSALMGASCFMGSYHVASHDEKLAATKSAYDWVAIPDT